MANQLACGVPLQQCSTVRSTASRILWGSRLWASSQSSQLRIEIASELHKIMSQWVNDCNVTLSLRCDDDYHDYCGVTIISCRAAAVISTGSCWLAELETQSRFVTIRFIRFISDDPDSSSRIKSIINEIRRDSNSDSVSAPFWMKSEWRLIMWRRVTSRSRVTCQQSRRVTVTRVTCVSNYNCIECICLQCNQMQRCSDFKIFNVNDIGSSVQYPAMCQCVTNHSRCELQRIVFTADSHPHMTGRECGMRSSKW